MNHQEFMHFLRHKTPNHPNYEPETRAYKNASGVDELIHLHRGSWDYVDWLETNTDIRFAEWVIHCDNNPSDGFTLSHLLMYWLWKDECNRFSQGYLTPNPYPPMGYEGWGDIGIASN